METQTTQQKLSQLQTARQARFNLAQAQRENIERVLANVELTNRFSDNELRLSTLRNDTTLFSENRRTAGFQEGLLGNYEPDPLYSHIQHLTRQCEDNSYGHWSDHSFKHVFYPIFGNGLEQQQKHLEAKDVIRKVKNLFEERKMPQGMYDQLNDWENKGYYAPHQIRRMVEIYQETFPKEKEMKGGNQ